jgi:thiamine-phosphate pyrophosphorylase
MNMISTKQIKGGLYLVVDPAPGIAVLLPKVEQAIKGGVDVIQVWNNWQVGQNKTELIHLLCGLAHQYNIPVLINEEWQLLQTTDLDGFHSDTIPGNIDEIRSAVGRPFIFGITCGNNLNTVNWATQNKADYISFCSMFPSPSAGVCEIVNKETVIAARRLTTMPIFVAGGITLANIEELRSTQIDGVALISGIMKADNVQLTTKEFKEKLLTLKPINDEPIIGK